MLYNDKQKTFTFLFFLGFCKILSLDKSSTSWTSFQLEAGGVHKTSQDRHFKSRILPVLFK